MEGNNEGLTRSLGEHGNTSTYFKGRTDPFVLFLGPEAKAATIFIFENEENTAKSLYQQQSEPSKQLQKLVYNSICLQKEKGAGWVGQNFWISKMNFYSSIKCVHTGFQSKLNIKYL